MRKSVFTFATLVLATALPCASWAKRFTAPETAVSFEAPAGFTALSDDEIKAKYLSNHAPRFILGNPPRRTTVAYEIRPHAIFDSALEKAMVAFEQLLSRIIPGIV